MHGLNLYLEGPMACRDLKKTTAGKNVTNLRDEGPVVLEQGKTTILSTQETSIVSDFEVKLGAELEINVGN